MKRLFFTTYCIICITLCTFATSITESNIINLAGEWMFMTDRDNVGETYGWYKPDFEYKDRIKLPGSMPQRGKGDNVSVKTPWVGAIYDSSYYHNPYMEKYRQEGSMKLPFFLTPAKHYIGKAWYKKVVTLTEEQARQCNVLYLERPHIISKVWINGVPTASGAINTLSVPHQHIIKADGTLKAGQNTIVICIDNDPDKVNVGMDSHSVSDQTQGCWNGIVGKIELRPASHIKSINVFPDIDNHKANLKMALHAIGQGKEEITITLIAESFNTATRHIITPKPLKITLDAARDSVVDIALDMGKDMLLWDEFFPNMYRLTTEIKSKNGTDLEETFFGMRKIEIRGKMFYVNGKQIMLRGNVDSCLFPETGYPPTDIDSWLAIFEKYKKWGLNHVRFHSYCPPEAAFLAADLMGLYIQPEGPSWPNHGVKLGRGEYIDTYLYEEAQRICDEFGNHPSFTFFAFGNEPAGNWVRWCNDHMPLIKAYDPRHIYAGFSVGGGWAWQPQAEFAVKAGARGLSEWVRSAPESMANFSDKITTYNGKDMPGTPITVPFVTHEMGQWCVFPNFAEISKYKGVNKAANFEIFRDMLKDNGMQRRERDFLLASGKLQALCYKYETERILRTPDYAGFQLLALNDYSGQGSALVGVTDVFYDEKGYITPPEFREFCSQVVPLARFPKFTYSNTESFEADLELAQFSGDTLKGVTPHWIIYREPRKQSNQSLVVQETPLAEGDLPTMDLPIGQNIPLGHITLPLSSVSEPTKFTLCVSLPGVTRYGFAKKDKIYVKNHWDFWVFPDTHSDVNTDRKGKRPGTFFYDNIYVTDSLDRQARSILKRGGKVLICAAGKVTYGREVKQQFLPVFWNTSWFKMRPPHTTGIYVENTHPLFDTFPTDYHSDMQWWELVNKAQVMQFTDFPLDFQPLVQSIDTWFVNRKIGMLFEARVGKGRLLMTTMDITNNLDKRLAARQMRQSILDYMHSFEFQPRWEIDFQRVADLFTKVAGEVNMYTNESPDELKPTIK